MGLLDSVLGGVLGQRDAAQAGGGNPKLMLALGLLAMLAARHQGRRRGAGRPAESQGGACSAAGACWVA